MATACVQYVVVMHVFTMRVREINVHSGSDDYLKRDTIRNQRDMERAMRNDDTACRNRVSLLLVAMSPRGSLSFLTLVVFLRAV